MVAARVYGASRPQQTCPWRLVGAFPVATSALSTRNVVHDVLGLVIHTLSPIRLRFPGIRYTCVAMRRPLLRGTRPDREEVCAATLKALLVGQTTKNACA